MTYLEWVIKWFSMTKSESLNESVWVVIMSQYWWWWWLSHSLTEAISEVNKNGVLYIIYYSCEMIGQNWSISVWSGWIMQNRANVRMFAVVWFALFERKVVNNHLVTFDTKIRFWYDHMRFMMRAFHSSLISTQIFKSRKINKYQFKA